MTILDTNVLSALMQSTPDPVVVAWLDKQPSESVWTTAITVFEIRFGLSILPSGRRRRRLDTAFTSLLQDDLEGRVLAVDTVAGERAGLLAAERHRAGRPVDLRDTLIAGIAVARRATVATRNTRHFKNLPVSVVNPWESSTRQERV